MSDIETTKPEQEWWIYTGSGIPHDRIRNETIFKKPPVWRRFKYDETELLDVPVDNHTSSYKEQKLGEQARGANFQVDQEELEIINAALLLRRPLLVTGKPGVGKSTLAYAVAHELQLGPVLRWSITTSTTLRDGEYYYDAIGRLGDVTLAEKEANITGNTEFVKEIISDIGRYIMLGPLGTAMLPYRYPRVLLIDEIDKSDIDLPNNLLNIFEEGEFYIPELRRGTKFSNLKDENELDSPVWIMSYDGTRVPIRNGQVHCASFPFVVMTSNGEREFPPAFLRRCLQLNIKPPTEEKLVKIVEAHLGKEVSENANNLIKDFLNIQQEDQADLSTDQLLNALYLSTKGGVDLGDLERLKRTFWRYLSLTGEE